MPAVFGNQSGDVNLVTSDYVDVDIQVADTGISFDVGGRCGLKSGALISIAKQTVAGPAVPGAGTTFYILQCAVATGTVTLKTDPSATPAVDAGNVLLLSGQLPSTADNSLLNDNLVTPDEW